MRGKLNVVLAAMLLMLAITATGCAAADGGAEDRDGVASANGARNGEPDDGTGEDNEPLSEDALHDKLLEYAQCLRDNGLDVEDPAPGEGVQVQVEGNSSQADKAMKACEDVAPPPPSDADEAEEREGMLKVAKCMRDNGVEAFADPKPGEGIDIGPEVAEDPDFEAAEKKCQHAGGESRSQTQGSGL